MAFEILAKADANGFISGNIKKGNPKLSTHFNAAEFQCPCCGEYKVAVKLLEGLEMIQVQEVCRCAGCTQQERSCED